MSSYQQPDPTGHFGIYGGSFVSETLTHAISELREAYAKYQHDPEFLEEFRYELAHFVGRPSPIYHAARMQPRTGRRANLPQARRPQPHRRPQDQQRDRPGDAGPAHGQAARDRRNRRRPARRGHRHHLRALRPGMRGLHGQRGRQAPEPQRLPHEPAGRHRGAGRIRQQDPEGRAQRGDARLGHQRRKHLLHHRHRGRPAPLPDDGARLPERDRQRVHHADASSWPAASPTWWSPASAAAATRWASSTPTSPSRRPA